MPCCGGRAASSPAASTGLRPRDACWTWAPATAFCSTRSAAAGARGSGSSATRGVRTSAASPSIGIEGSWAAVVFWHSLEHLPRPGEAIREAARLLSPGGVLVVAVPNSASLQAAAFGDRWLALDLPRHLVHLPLGALVSRLEACGFDVERVSQLRGGQIVIGWLDGLVGSLPGGLDLYQSLRRPRARRVTIGGGRRASALAAGVLLLPLAVACAAVEVGLRRSGTVYVEARKHA